MGKQTNNKWQQYEQTKRQLRAMNLTPTEYERRLREIAKKLRI